MTPHPPIASDHVHRSRHALAVVADIESFSGRDNREQMRTRQDLYEEVRTAFGASLWQSCYSEDRGDGLLVVVPHSAGAAHVIGEVLPALDRALSGRRRGDPLLRLRIAAHAGDVYADGEGIGGHAVNHAFRLCDAEPLRAALKAARSDTALLLSDSLYETIAHDGHPSVTPAAFHAVAVTVKETAARAWLHVPGDEAAAAGAAAAAPARGPEAATTEAAPPARSGGVSFGSGDVTITRGAVAGRDIVRHSAPRRWWQRDG